MADIFIAYSHRDQRLAEALASELQRERWSLFIDWELRTGTRWEKDLEAEVQSARAVLVLWSASSIQSRQVRKEALIARKREVLFPAFIEKLRGPPRGYGKYHAADLVGWTAAGVHAGYRRLVRDLHRHLGPAGDAPTFVPDGPAQARAIARMARSAGVTTAGERAVREKLGAPRHQALRASLSMRRRSGAAHDIAIARGLEDLLMGNARAAVTTLTELIERFPDEPDLFFFRASAWTLLDEHRRAEQDDLRHTESGGPIGRRIALPSG